MSFWARLGRCWTFTPELLCADALVPESFCFFAKTCARLKKYMCLGLCNKDHGAGGLTVPMHMQKDPLLISSIAHKHVHNQHLAMRWPLRSLQRLAACHSCQREYLEANWQMDGQCPPIEGPSTCAALQQCIICFGTTRRCLPLIRLACLRLSFSDHLLPALFGPLCLTCCLICLIRLLGS
jgi:hypothetical protein